MEKCLELRRQLKPCQVRTFCEYYLMDLVISIQFFYGLYHLVAIIFFYRLSLMGMYDACFQI